MKMNLNCVFCNEEYKSNPIVLPCGWTICEDHLKNGEISNCRFCKKQHKYEPNKHLNIKVLTLLKRKKQAKEINELEKSVEELKTALNDPEYYIDNYFRKLIDEMQLRKEEILESIKKYFEDKIDKIEERKASLIQRLKQNEEMASNLKKIDPEKMKIELKQIEFKQNDNTEGKNRKLQTLIFNLC